jgi:hypothetical protein
MSGSRLAKRIAIGAGVLTMSAVLLGSAPAWGSGHPSKSNTWSVKTAAATYLADVAPVNAAEVTFNAAIKTWTSSTPISVAVTATKPLISAYQDLDTKLVAGRWPTSALTDIRSLVEADGILIGDLQGLPSVNALNSSTWSTTVARDAASSGTAIAFVRHDLGLPKATS